MNQHRHRAKPASNVPTSELEHLAHELNNVLANVRQSAELLAEERLGPLSDAQREVADILRQNSRKLQGLTRSLLERAGLPRERADNGGRGGAA